MNLRTLGTGSLSHGLRVPSFDMNLETLGVEESVLARVPASRSKLETRNACKRPEGASAKSSEIRVRTRNSEPALKETQEQELLVGS